VRLVSRCRIEVAHQIMAGFRGRSLSPRENDIVELVAQGFRNKEIGEKLFISEQTVKNHLHNIFYKLGIRDRQALAAFRI
jgi:DNA-binding NarL/FixJ family response regulator